MGSGGGRRGADSPPWMQDVHYAMRNAHYAMCMTHMTIAHDVKCIGCIARGVMRAWRDARVA